MSREDLPSGVSAFFVGRETETAHKTSHLVVVVVVMFSSVSVLILVIGRGRKRDGFVCLFVFNLCVLPR